MIKKIQLISNCLAYGPAPAPDDEIEQHITLLSDGRVWLSRYCYGRGYKYEIKEKETFRIHMAEATRILQAIEICFEAYDPMLVTDIGTWDLSITYKNENTKQITGSLCKDDFIEKHHLSKRIRTAFNRENLFLFDGRSAKKPDDLIFCNVRFDNSSRTYCYLADTDEYEEGDQAVVLAGEEKREAIVTIVSIQYLPAEKAPYPLDKIKHILRKHEGHKNPVTVFKELEKIAYAPYDTIPNPTAKEWKKSYDALLQLVEMKPDEGTYPNTLGYLCYYGRHTDGIPQFEEARKWFELGTKLNMIESMYKLADMLLDGLGGEKDVKRAVGYYNDLYWFCRDQQEAGKVTCKFADVALRVGKLFHDGTAGKQDDMLALNYLLEARFAIAKRKPFNRYGDDKVEKNIEAAIEACEQPPEELKKQELIEMGLGRVPEYFLRDDHLMSFNLAISEDGILRIRFVRKDPDKLDAAWGSAVIWAVPPTMECFSTSFITVYGQDVRMVWNQNPGKEVLCDRYEYDENKRLHQFFLKDTLTCKLMGGEYYLYMTDLRPLKPIKKVSKLDPFKQILYDTAKKNQEEHPNQVIDFTCPLCGQETMYASIIDNRLFAACKSCFEMINIPWPDEDEIKPFDLQKTWKHV